jgi:AcrR family transcriptional regulator
MAQLDANRIAFAAWKLVDQGGLPAFTIRNVAEELGVTPMAIYHHVRDKAALATVMVEMANLERPLSSPTGDWREDLWLMARSMRETRLAHPVLPQLRRQYRVWTPALLRISERWVSIWQQSGLELEQALIAARASSQAVVGMIDEEAVYEGEEPPSEELLSWVPITRVLFQKDFPQDELFELAVRSLIDGIYTRLRARGRELTSATARGRAKRMRGT